MKSRTRTLCITLSIVLLAGLLGCVGFWLLIRHSVNAVYAFENAAKEQSAQHEDSVALKALLSGVGPDLDTLKTRVVDANGTVPFINSIEALARQAGAKVNIDSVSVGPASAEGDSFEQLNLAVSTQGSWSQVGTFLAMIESLPYKVEIPSVSLTQGAFSEAQGSTTSKTVIQWKGSYTLSVLKNK